MYFGGGREEVQNMRKSLAGQLRNSWITASTSSAHDLKSLNRPLCHTMICPWSIFRVRWFFAAVAITSSEFCFFARLHPPSSPARSERCLFCLCLVPIFCPSVLPSSDSPYGPLTLQDSGGSVPLDPHTSLSTITQVITWAAWAPHTNQHFYHGRQDSDFLLVMRFFQSQTWEKE